MSRTYGDLPDEDQVEVLRRIALDAAQMFALRVESMEVVTHAYNTTFRCDTSDTRRVALRVNTNSKSTPSQVAGQQAWQHAIVTQTSVEVPVPLRTHDGAWYARVSSRDLGRDVLATASGWLPGPDIGPSLGPVQAKALGVAMAVLHEHAERWILPADAELPTFDTPLFGDEDRLSDWPGFEPTQHAVVEEAMAQCAETFDRVCTGQRLIPIHGDLHGSNLKWNDGRLAIFDFDDAGLGHPAMDLAIATFYLREPTGEVEAALLEGYLLNRPSPTISPSDFEAIVAARQLLLANAILSSTTQGLRDEGAEYAFVAVARLEAWLRTGRFERTSGT